MTHHVTAGVQELVQYTAQLVGRTPGAHTFELRYEITNRTAEPAEPARPGDTIRWVAAATHVCEHGVTTIQGTALIEPGGSPVRGISWACIRLLQQLGVTTNVVDAGDGTEPPQ